MHNIKWIRVKTDESVRTYTQDLFKGKVRTLEVRGSRESARASQSGTVTLGLDSLALDTDKHTRLQKICVSCPFFSFSSSYRRILQQTTIHRVTTCSPFLVFVCLFHQQSKDAHRSILDGIPRPPGTCHVGVV
jgi:hypothetical protein